MMLLEDVVETLDRRFYFFLIFCVPARVKNVRHDDRMYG